MRGNRIPVLVTHRRACWWVLAGLALAGAAGAQTAGDIAPGLDLWSTPGTGITRVAFSDNPIPAGFFDPGSDPFVGTVVLQGGPLAQSAGPALSFTDTVVSRLDTAQVPNVGDQDTIPIEIVALSLVSVNPITVTFNGGQNPEAWTVAVCLSDTPQVPGSMTIHRTCPQGGTFDSTLPVRPKFFFTRTTPPAMRILDAGAMGQIQFGSTNGRWVETANPSLGITRVQAGAVVDRNCDGTPDPPLPGSSNFTPGVYESTCVCVTSPPGQAKTLTQEEQMLEAHGVLPPQEPPPDDDADGIANDADNCPTTPNALQQDRDNDLRGDACDNCPDTPNPCQEDGNGNGIGDACELFVDGFESGNSSAWTVAVGG